MTDSNMQIHLSTVLLEINRWTRDKIPTFKVSAWAAAIRDAGFDGLELWENHAVLADEQEQAALSRMPLPISIFNSYCTFDDDGEASRRQAVDFVKRLGAAGVKFNLGNEPARTDEYVRNLQAWADAVPADCRLLCECHGGTVLETPTRAKSLLAMLAGRVEIIVHAFIGEREILKQWLDHFGPAVTHVHVVSRQSQGLMGSLNDMEDEARARVALLKAAGFAGSWSIEFTRGVALSPEDKHALLATAAEDMAFLRANA